MNQKQPSSLGQNLLRTTKAPFVLVLLISLLGTSLGYVGSSIRDEPTVEYKATVFSDREIDYRIKNISRTTLFKDLTFRVGLTDTSLSTKISCNTDLTGSPPMWLGRFDERSTCNTDPGMATFMVPRLQPQGTVNLSVQTDFPRTLQTIYVDAEQPISLRKASFYTWIAKNLECIALGMCGIFLILIISHVFYVMRFND